MPEFYSLAAFMALVAMLFVLFPLMTGRSGQAGERSQANVLVYREQLATLETDYQAGTYNEQEFYALKTELERHLLEDVAEEDGAGHAGSAGSRLLLALLVPLLGFFLYNQVGALPDWQITRALNSLQQQSDETARQEALQSLAGKLESRLEQVDVAEYNMLLARSQMELNNYPAAAEAYRRLSLQVPEDPAVLGQYAQALYLASGRKMTPEVKRVSERALALNPRQSTVLGMMGIDSFERGDYKAAANYWEQLLPSLQPGTPNEEMIRQGINQARQLAGLAPLAEEKQQEDAVAAALQVSVTLSDELDADPGAQVFVFARAVGGPPMPLAVARMTVADLPAQVRLDDSMAMTPALKLSSFESVEVVARISKRGIANRGSGDMEGSFGPVSPGEAGPIKVYIDSVLP